MPLFRIDGLTMTTAKPPGIYRIMLVVLVVLVTPGVVLGSPAIESPSVIAEADLLTEQAYLLDASSLQNRLANLQHRWVDQPEQFEAMLVVWIRALANQPSDPTLDQTLTALEDYQPRVMTDHPDRYGHQVPKYTIGAEISATRNTWILFDTEQLTNAFIVANQLDLLDQHLNQLSHRQSIAGTARALTQAVNQGASEALTDWLLNTQDHRSIRASVFNQMIDHVESMSWRLTLSEQILTHGHSVDQALHLRLLDARMGRQQAIAIRQYLIEAPKTPLTLYRLAFTQQALALPNDRRLITTAIDDLDSAERGTASAFALSKTEPTLTRSMLLGQYLQLAPAGRHLSRLVMIQRRDNEALIAMDVMDRQEVLK